AVAQRDLKQLLAASTCAQIGFMVLAAGVASIEGGVGQLVAHAAVKSLLFLCAGVWLTVLGTKDLRELQGAAWRNRVVGVAFGMGALALAGIPPLSLWVTKDVVLAAAVAEGSWVLYAVGLAASVLAAAYSARALVAVWRRGERHGSEGAFRFPMLAPLPVLAFIAVVFGVVAVPGVDESWRGLLGASGEPAPNLTELLISGALAVVTVVAVAGLARHRRGT
ncbi:proton-conducting transporter membrane subunit, partial [Actinomadura adrarensis]